MTPISRPVRPGLPFLFWGIALAVMGLSSFVGHMAPARLYPLVWGCAASLAVYALIRWLAARDGRTLASIGLGADRGSPLRFALGLALGGGTVAVILAISALVLGPIGFARVAGIDPAAIAAALAGLMATVMMEELVFRSYSLWTSIAAFGKWWGQAIAVAAFAALHIAYGWPITTVLTGVVPSGVLLGIAAVVSRGLALPAGIHLGMVAARLICGETPAPLIFGMDTSALDPARAAIWAPIIGTSIPLIAATVLWLSWPSAPRAVA